MGNKFTRWMWWIFWIKWNEEVRCQLIIQYNLISIIFNILLCMDLMSFLTSFAEADAQFDARLTRFRNGSCADSRASRSGHGSGLGDGPYDEYLCWKALSVCCQFYSKNLWPGKMTLSWNLNTDDHGIILDIDDEYWSIVQYHWSFGLGMGNAVFMHDMFGTLLDVRLKVTWHLKPSVSLPESDASLIDVNSFPLMPRCRVLLLQAVPSWSQSRTQFDSWWMDHGNTEDPVAWKNWSMSGVSS